MAGKSATLKPTNSGSEPEKVHLLWKIRLKPETLIISVILIFTFLIYSGALRNQFLIGWDDGEYISDPVVNSDGPVNTSAIFSNYYLGMYQPLAVLSFALNYKMAGQIAWPYILTNILLHLLNTWLVFRLMKRWMNGIIPAAVVSLLFAIHPMHVEAVAWIAARSTSLYTLFFLAGLIQWDKYLGEGQKPGHYLTTLLLFTLALFSKSMAATFPLVLFVLDFMKGRKAALKIFIEKIPFLLLSVIFGLLTIKAAASFGHITVLEQDFTLAQRIALIFYGIAFYLVKLPAPVNLSAIYAFPGLTGGNLPAYVYSSALIPAAVLAGIWFSGKYRREFLSGFLIFLLSISMVLPLFWSRIFITADRYTYLPYIGLFMIIGRLFAEIYSVSPAERLNRNMLRTISVLIAGLLSIATLNRIHTWNNTPGLLTDVIEKKRSDADMAHGYFYLGNYYDAAGNEEQAMKYYSLSLSRNSRYLLALNNRGILKGKAGDFEGAVLDFNAALRIKPDYAEAYYNRGVALYQTGKAANACDDWDRAYQLKFKPAGDALRQYCHKHILPDFGKAGN